MAAFLGNPNIITSAINVSGGIVASRTSGELPAFVQVSASAITATGTVSNGAAIIPYEDLEFSWNFGDPSGTEIFTNPVTGRTTNANIQRGPEAAYVYRAAGTYTITLTVRGITALPSNNVCTQFITNTATVSFTASAFSKSGGEYYFSSSGSDANDGLTSATPKQNLATLNTLMAAGHMQFNLARGSNWVGTTGIIITQSDIRIVPYGTGANPIINMLNATNGGGSTGAIYNALSCNNTSRSASNIVVSNIDCWRSGTTPNTIVNFVFANLPANNAFDNYFDNINIVSDSSTAVQAKWLRYEFPLLVVTSNVQRMGVWGGSINRTVADLAEDIGVYGGALYWNFFVGITPFRQNGQASAPTLVHSIYCDFQGHGLFRWINFGGGINLNANIKMSHNSLSGAYELGNYYLLSENNFGNVQQGCGMGNSAGVYNELSDVGNFVIQLNAFHDLSLAATTSNAVVSATWRHNNVWSVTTSSGALFGVNNNARFINAGELAANIKFYGNNIYRNVSTAQTSGLSPFCQKTITGQGTGTWDNGSGGSGDILTATTYGGVAIALLTPGEIILFAPAAHPGNGIVQAYGTAGTTGTGGTGTYKISQSALITPAVTFQAVWGWTTPWTITDNVVYDTSSTPALMDLQFTNQATATVNRNTWYAPSGSVTPGVQTGTAFFNNRFSQTFAQVKAAGFSANDTVADPTTAYPYWSDPANGVFATRRRMLLKT